MSYSLKQPTQITFNSPTVQITTTTFKLSNTPALNNSNTDFLTRNSVTGNLERTTAIPNIYNANGIVSSNRTVSVPSPTNLTFNGGGALTFSSWASGMSLNNASIGPISMSGTTIGISADSAINIGVSGVMTTNISSGGGTLDARAGTLKMSNVPINALSTLAISPLFLQVNETTRNVTADYLPIDVAVVTISGVITPILTSAIPTSVLGNKSLLKAYFMGFFPAAPEYNLTYDNSANINVPSKTILRRFICNVSGYIVAPINQIYTAAIAIDGVNVTNTTTRITVTSNDPTQFSLFPVVLTLNVGQTVAIAFGRETSDTTINYTCGISLVPAAMYAF